MESEAEKEREDRLRDIRARMEARKLERKASSAAMSQAEEATPGTPTQEENPKEEKSAAGAGSESPVLSSMSTSAKARAELAARLEQRRAERQGGGLSSPSLLSGSRGSAPLASEETAPHPPILSLGDSESAVTVGEEGRGPPQEDPSRPDPLPGPKSSPREEDVAKVSGTTGALATTAPPPPPLPPPSRQALEREEEVPVVTAPTKSLPVAASLSSAGDEGGVSTGNERQLEEVDKEEKKGVAVSDSGESKEPRLAPESRGDTLEENKHVSPQSEGDGPALESQKEIVVPAPSLGGSDGAAVSADGSVKQSIIADPLEHTDVATSNSKGACMEPQLSAAARRQHRILELVAEDSSKGGRLPPHTAAPAAGSSTSPTLRAKKVLSLVQARRQPADASEMLEHPSAAVSSIKESREAASLSQEEASRAAALRIHQLSRSSGQYPRSADTPADSIVEVDSRPPSHVLKNIKAFAKDGDPRVEENRHRVQRGEAPPPLEDPKKEDNSLASVSARIKRASQTQLTSSDWAEWNQESSNLEEGGIEKGEEKEEEEEEEEEEEKEKEGDISAVSNAEDARTGEVQMLRLGSSPSDGPGLDAETNPVVESANAELAAVERQRQERLSKWSKFEELRKNSSRRTLYDQTGEQSPFCADLQPLPVHTAPRSILQRGVSWIQETASGLEDDDKAGALAQLLHQAEDMQRSQEDSGEPSVNSGREHALSSSSSALEPVLQPREGDDERVIALKKELLWVYRERSRIQGLMQQEEGARSEEQSQQSKAHGAGESVSGVTGEGAEGCEHPVEEEEEGEEEVTGKHKKVIQEDGTKNETSTGQVASQQQDGAGAGDHVDQGASSRPLSGSQVRHVLTAQGCKRNQSPPSRSSRSPGKGKAPAVDSPDVQVAGPRRAGSSAPSPRRRRDSRAQNRQAVSEGASPRLGAAEHPPPQYQLLLESLVEDEKAATAAGVLLLSASPPKVSPPASVEGNATLVIPEGVPSSSSAPLLPESSGSLGPSGASAHSASPLPVSSGVGPGTTSILSRHNSAALQSRARQSQYSPSSAPPPAAAASKSPVPNLDLTRVSSGFAARATVRSQVFRSTSAPRQSSSNRNFLSAPGPSDEDMIFSVSSTPSSSRKASLVQSSTNSPRSIPVKHTLSGGARPFVSSNGSSNKVSQAPSPRQQRTISPARSVSAGPSTSRSRSGMLSPRHPKRNMKPVLVGRTFASGQQVRRPAPDSFDLGRYLRLCGMIPNVNTLRAKEKPVRWLMRVIEDVYDERFSYESQLQSAHQEEFLSECKGSSYKPANSGVFRTSNPVPIQDFIYDFFMKRYGLQSLAEQTLWNVMCNVELYRKEYLEVEIFGRFLDDTYDASLLSIFILTRYFCIRIAGQQLDSEEFVKNGKKPVFLTIPMFMAALRMVSNQYSIPLQELQRFITDFVRQFQGPSAKKVEMARLMFLLLRCLSSSTPGDGGGALRQQVPEDVTVSSSLAHLPSAAAGKRTPSSRSSTPSYSAGGHRRGEELLHGSACPSVTRSQSPHLFAFKQHADLLEEHKHRLELLRNLKEETSKGQERERDRKKRASGIEELILQRIRDLKGAGDASSSPVSHGSQVDVLSSEDRQRARLWSLVLSEKEEGGSLVPQLTSSMLLKPHGAGGSGHVSMELHGGVQRRREEREQDPWKKADSYSSASPGDVHSLSPIRRPLSPSYSMTSGDTSQFAIGGFSPSKKTLKVRSTVASRSRALVGKDAAQQRPTAFTSQNNISTRASSPGLRTQKVRSLDDSGLAPANLMKILASSSTALAVASTLSGSAGVSPRNSRSGTPVLSTPPSRNGMTSVQASAKIRKGGLASPPIVVSSPATVEPAGPFLRTIFAVLGQEDAAKRFSLAFEEVFVELGRLMEDMAHQWVVDVVGSLMEDDGVTSSNFEDLQSQEFYDMVFSYCVEAMAPHVCDMLADLEVATRSGFAGKQSAQVQALRHCLNLFSGGQQQDEAKEALSALLHALLGEHESTGEDDDDDVQAEGKMTHLKHTVKEIVLAEIQGASV